MKIVQCICACIMLSSLSIISGQCDMSTDDFNGPNPQIVVGHIAQIVEHAVDMSEDKSNHGPHIAGIFANVLGIVLQIAQNRNMRISELDQTTIIEYMQDVSPIFAHRTIKFNIEEYTNDIDETDPRIIVSHIARIIEHVLEMLNDQENTDPYIASIFTNVVGIVLEIAKHNKEILNNNDALIVYIDDITPEIKRQIQNIKR